MFLLCRVLERSSGREAIWSLIMGKLDRTRSQKGRATTPAANTARAAAAGTAMGRSKPKPTESSKTPPKSSPKTAFLQVWLLFSF